MNRLVVSLWLFVLTMLTGCKNDDPIAAEIIMQVADHRQDCVGVAPQKCLLVKTEGDANWTFFYDKIDGFTYEEGYTYRLLVKRTSVANPPADGSSMRYTLIQVLDKTNV